MPPVYINGQEVVKRYVGIQEVIAAYVGSQQVFSSLWLPLSLTALRAWYDLSDLSTMFQDSAGTIPVTAHGQPVGKILDKSGNGYHASQPSNNSRPLYKTDGTYHRLWFDGVDDFLVTASNIGISAPPLSSFSGVLAADVTKNQCCWSNGRYIDGINISKQRFTTVGALDYYQTTPTLLSGSKYVFSKVFDTGFDCKFRTNGANEELVFGVADTGSAQDVLIIGAYSGGYYFYGDLFSLIICAAQCSVAEIAAAEQFVAAKTGVFF